MAVFKCKMCGGNLAITAGNPVVQCEYCGSVQTVPSADNEKKMTLFSRANRLRFDCEFDKASGVYEAIVADFPEEAEAYWGLVLCKYGIEYVDDPATGNKIPTCHRSSFNSVMEDDDFEQTLENADSTARKIYREEAKQIEDLRKGILEVSSKADPYDIFICYKETDENGERTLDSVLAQDLYDALTNKGYRVFFARITLEDKLGEEYEPYIFAALNSAKVMLAIGTDYEHYNAIWVRNEWSRYLKLMSEDHTKHLIPCFKGIDAYDIPKEFAKLQAQDLGKVGATQDLLRGIDKLITPTAPTPTAPKGAEIAPLLALGNEALDKGEWSIASSRFDLALTVDPMCAEAYLGKLMAKYRCKRRDQLAKSKMPIHKDSQYKQALSFADDALKEELEGYSQKVIAARKRLIRLSVIVTLSIVIVSVISFFIAMEVNYRNTIRDFYAQKITARDAYSRLTELQWYREPDECTQLLINKQIPKVYTSAANITSITVPKYVTDIHELMFNGCRSLTSITIPDSVTNIGNRAFNDCVNLKTITMPKSITRIGDSAFSGCSSLTSITIPKGVTSIGDYMFYNCRSLTSIVIPNSVTSIGVSAFSNCSSLTSVTIPEGVTGIGENAFYSCSSLTSVTIPEGVTGISQGVFYDCSSLISVTIPDSVIKIGTNAFNGCSSLTSIIIPKSVTSIGKYAFYECRGLKSVTIPEGVTSIDDWAFRYCVSLESVTVSEGLTRIGHYAFYICDSLTSIAIPEGVTSIGDLAFGYCTNLTSISIPDSLTSVGDNTFKSCISVKEVYFKSEAQRDKFKNVYPFKRAQLIVE